MNNQPKVYVASIGMVTPLGFNSATTVAAVRARVSSYEASDYHNHAGEALTLSLVPDGVFNAVEIEIDEGEYYSAQYGRTIKLAIFALQQIFEQISLTRPVPLILALAEPQNSVRHIDPQLLIRNLLNQPGMMIASDKIPCIDKGRAGGLAGLDLALRYLYDANEDYVLLGGSDSHLSGERLNDLDRQRRLLAPGAGDGFAPGEGAAFLLLTRHPAQALCRNGHIIALLPPGISREPGHLFSDEPYKGDGLDKAFKKALASHTGDPICSVYSSMNGEHYWAKEYGVAMIRNAKHFSEKVETEHPADCYGDLGSATGSALLGVAAEELFSRRDMTRCLIYGASDNGWRAAAWMEKLAYPEGDEKQGALAKPSQTELAELAERAVQEAQDFGWLVCETEGEGQ